MSGKTPKDKSPEQNLALLLDALATELLAAPDHEVAATLWDCTVSLFAVTNWS